jgi:hypothetical protein
VPEIFVIDAGWPSGWSSCVKRRAATSLSMLLESWASEIGKLSSSIPLNCSLSGDVQHFLRKFYRTLYSAKKSRHSARSDHKGLYLVLRGGEVYGESLLLFHFENRTKLMFCRGQTNKLGFYFLQVHTSVWERVWAVGPEWVGFSRIGRTQM